MTERILATTFDHWGLLGLLAVCGLAMVASSVTTAIQLLRWKPQTAIVIQQTDSILTALRVVADKMERQHASCTQHYQFAQTQIEGMRSIGAELARVVAAIHESDKERNREILNIVMLIAGKSRVSD